MRAALEAGADAVEFDLHVAACGTPVLMHDATLERTTGHPGRVDEIPFAELQGFDAGSWFASDFEGERIPGLHEALDLVSGTDARVYAEVKGYRSLMDLLGIIDVTRFAGALERTVFISMDWRALESLRSMEPSLSVGYIVEDVTRFPEGLHVATEHGGVLDFDARILLADPTIARRTAEAGVEMAVWTVNDPDVAESLWSMGVTSFTTDEVGALIEWRANR